MQLSSLELVLPETWMVNFSIAELDRCAELPSYEDKLKFFFENQRRSVVLFQVFYGVAALQRLAMACPRDDAAAPHRL